MLTHSFLLHPKKVTSNCKSTLFLYHHHEGGEDLENDDNFQYLLKWCFLLRGCLIEVVKFMGYCVCCVFRCYHWRDSDLSASFHHDRLHFGGNLAFQRLTKLAPNFFLVSKLHLIFKSMCSVPLWPALLFGFEVPNEHLAPPVMSYG